MEHAVSLDNVRPWRTAALVASAVAALELVALVAAAAALVGKPLLNRRHTAVAPQRKAAPARTKARPKPRVHPILPRERTTVLVLNGNGQTGAAAAEADVARTKGYPIGAVGNARERTSGPSVVMYRPGFEREARRLARDIAISRIAPLDGMRPSDLRRSKLVVVVGF